VLTRDHLPDPPGLDGAWPAPRKIRFACQLRPRRSVEVIPLLPPFAYPGDERRRVELAQGSERETAILFDNVHGFIPEGSASLRVGIWPQPPFCLDRVPMRLP
jgi:hypothetical protein